MHNSLNSTASFADVLNTLLNENHITAASLAKASGLSAPVISRLKSGKREFTGNSESYLALVQGLSRLSQKSLEDIMALFDPVLKNPGLDEAKAIAKFNELIQALNLNVHDLSRFLNFDPSYLSRIRQNKRHPADMPKFLNDVSRYAARISRQEDLQKLNQLLEKDLDDLSEEEIAGQISLWLTSQETLVQTEKAGISHFLGKLDQFDLAEFLRTLPVQPAVYESISDQEDRVYTTIEGFKQAELDWLQTVIASDLTGEVVLYSDMPMEQMAQDPDFVKKWIAAMAAMIKKGCHVHMIHTISRNFSEMMLGLESYVPLYMTGQFSSWYFKGMKDPVFHHFLRTADSAVLCGEAIAGHHNQGRYFYSIRPEEIAYQKQKAKAMLEKADRLMDIYNSSRQKEYQQVLEEFQTPRKEGYRHILSSPMLYTMPEDLLEEMIHGTDLDSDSRQKILTYAKEQKEFFARQMETGPLSDEVGLISEEEFQRYPVCLPLSDLLEEYRVPYTYEQYCRHIACSLQMSGQYANYDFRAAENPALGNIQIRIIPQNSVLISKNTSPTIHFVIDNPRLRSAIEAMSISRREV